MVCLGRRGRIVGGIDYLRRTRVVPSSFESAALYVADVLSLDHPNYLVLHGTYCRWPEPTSRPSLYAARRAAAGGLGCMGCRRSPQFRGRLERVWSHVLVPPTS